MRSSIQVLALIGLAFAMPLRAAESAFPDIQRILDAGVVRVAIIEREVAPMIMEEENGDLTGVSPDLARDLAAKLGVEVEFVRSADTYEGVVDQVAALEADLGISFLSSGVERALRVYFSEPYIRQSGRVFFNRTAFARLKRDYDIDELGAIPDTAAVDAVVFGVLEGSIYETVLERDLPEVEITRYPDLNTLMQAVKDDRIFGGVHGELQIAFYMREHPSTAIHVAVDRELRSTSDISIAVRPDAPNLLRWVNVYLATNVGVEESDAIVERYAETLKPRESK